MAPFGSSSSFIHGQAGDVSRSTAGDAAANAQYNDMYGMVCRLHHSAFALSFRLRSNPAARLPLRTNLSSKYGSRCPALLLPACPSQEGATAISPVKHLKLAFSERFCEDFHLASPLLQGLSNFTLLPVGICARFVLISVLSRPTTNSVGLKMVAASAVRICLAAASR